MLGHEVNQRAFTYEKPHVNSRYSVGSSIITVEPPITPGENFSRAVLGEEANGVTLEHFLTTDVHTVFVATAHDNHERHTEQDAMAAINLIRYRIKKFADFPEQTLELMEEEVFPDARPVQYPHSHP